jgi:hypothetical protein
VHFGHVIASQEIRLWQKGQILRVNIVASHISIKTNPQIIRNVAKKTMYLAHSIFSNAPIFCKQYMQRKTRIAKAIIKDQAIIRTEICSSSPASSYEKEKNSDVQPAAKIPRIIAKNSKDFDESLFEIGATSIKKAPTKTQTTKTILIIKMASNNVNCLCCIFCFILLLFPIIFSLFITLFITIFVDLISPVRYFEKSQQGDERDYNKSDDENPILPIPIRDCPSKNKISKMEKTQQKIFSANFSTSNRSTFASFCSGSQAPAWEPPCLGSSASLQTRRPEKRLSCRQAGAWRTGAFPSGSLGTSQ